MKARETVFSLVAGSPCPRTVYFNSLPQPLGEESSGRSIHPSIKCRISLLISIIEDRSNQFFPIIFFAFKITCHLQKWIICVVLFCQKSGSRWIFQVRMNRADIFGIRSSHSQVIPPDCYQVLYLQSSSYGIPPVHFLSEPKPRCLQPEVCTQLPSLLTPLRIFNSTSSWVLK